MIVSHSKGFIFFAVPKTATQALRTALSPLLEGDDWQQQALIKESRSPVLELARIGHGHISVRQARPHFPADDWSDYFKFAIVRNPYDRFLSVCAFLNRQNPEFIGNETEWMLAALERPQFRARVLVQTQCNLLCGDDGKIGVDYAGRYEELDNALATIAGKLAMDALALERINVTPKPPQRKWYSSTLADEVRALYAADFERFGYSDKL